MHAYILYIHAYMHPCIDACIYTYIHTYTYTHTHIHIYTHTHIYMYINTYTHTHIHTYIYIYICIYIYVHTHIHPYTHTHTYTHIYIYIYMYIHRYTHTYIYIYIYITCIYLQLGGYINRFLLGGAHSWVTGWGFFTCKFKGGCLDDGSDARSHAASCRCSYFELCVQMSPSMAGTPWKPPFSMDTTNITWRNISI